MRRAWRRILDSSGSDDISVGQWKIQTACSWIRSTIKTGRERRRTKEAEKTNKKLGRRGKPRKYCNKPISHDGISHPFICRELG
jgi:hypothetical protein